MGAVVSDLEQLGRLIEHVATDLRRTTSQAARESAARTLARALTLVPTDKGELAASGRVVSRPDGFAVIFDAPHAEAIMRIKDETAAGLARIHGGMAKLAADANGGQTAIRALRRRPRPR